MSDKASFRFPLPLVGFRAGVIGVMENGELPMRGGSFRRTK